MKTELIPNWLTEENARALAARLKSYWAVEGYDVDVLVERQVYGGTEFGGGNSVWSATPLLGGNGLPLPHTRIKAGKLEG